MGVIITTRYTRQEFEEAVKTSGTIKEVMQKLNLCPGGASYRQFKKRVKEWEIDTSHFLTLQEIGSKILSNLSKEKRRTDEDVFRDGSNYRRSGLKSRLIDNNLKKKECELCGQSEDWNGKKLSFILDHINGKRDDNRIENLRILCPNCDSTLETYAGRNNKKIIDKPTRKIIRNYKIDWPSVEELLKRVKESNYTQVGRELGVSDNAIRKRIQTRT